MTESRAEGALRAVVGGRLQRRHFLGGGVAAALMAAGLQRRAEADDLTVAGPPNPVAKDTMELWWLSGGPPDAQVYAYVWDWGDGGEMDVYPAGINGAVHVYSANSPTGGYLVTVTAIDNAGNAMSAVVDPGVEVELRPATRPNAPSKPLPDAVMRSFTRPLHAKERRLTGKQDPRKNNPVAWGVERQTTTEVETFAWNWNYKLKNAGFGAESPEPLAAYTYTTAGPRLVTCRVKRMVTLPDGGMKEVRFLLGPRQMHVKD
jgi:hypothetical protein